MIVWKWKQQTEGKNKMRKLFEACEMPISGSDISPRTNWVVFVDRHFDRDFSWFTD